MISRKARPYLWVMLFVLVAVGIISYPPIFIQVWDSYKGREISFQKMTIDLGSNVFVFPIVREDYVLLGVRNEKESRFQKSGKLMISGATKPQYSLAGFENVCKKTNCKVEKKKSSSGVEWYEVKGSLLSFDGDYHVFFELNNDSYDVEYHGPKDDYSKFRSTLNSAIPELML